MGEKIMLFGMAETDGLEQPLPPPRISNSRRVITNGVNNTILPD